MVLGGKLGFPDGEWVIMPWAGTFGHLVEALNNVWLEQFHGNRARLSGHGGRRFCPDQANAQL